MKKEKNTIYIYIYIYSYVKGVQCYELFGGIALKIHTSSFFFSYTSMSIYYSSNTLNLESIVNKSFLGILVYHVEIIGICI